MQIVVGGKIISMGQAEWWVGPDSGGFSQAPLLFFLNERSYGPIRGSRESPLAVFMRKHALRRVCACFKESPSFKPPVMIALQRQQSLFSKTGPLIFFESIETQPLGYRQLFGFDLGLRIIPAHAQLLYVLSILPMFFATSSITRQLALRSCTSDLKQGGSHLLAKFYAVPIIYETHFDHSFYAMLF